MRPGHEAVTAVNAWMNRTNPASYDVLASAVVGEGAPTEVPDIVASAAGLAGVLHYRQAETGMPHDSRAAWQQERWRPASDAAH